MSHLLTDPTILTDLAAEPVTLEEAKAWMRVQYSTDDELIESTLIPAARKALERYCGRSFGEKNISAILWISCAGELYQLPWGPVTEITSVVLDQSFQAGETLVEGEDFELKGGLLRTNTTGVHTIEYVAGFAALPMDLKEDILRIVAWMYQNRGIRFEANTEPLAFPEWSSLNANRYILTVV